MRQSNARRQRGSTRRGLTLIELLVAVALGAILIGTITFIWLQSSRIFNTTVNTLESYQRLRTVLDILERDLANANKTIDMEPFQDGNGNGHFDPGEQLRTSGPATGAPLAAAAPAYRLPIDPNDPVRKLGASEPEFAEDAGLQGIEFFYGPFIHSPPPYTITTEGYLEKRNYWRDEIFFRTFLNEGDVSKPAMVHYRLVQADNGRSFLRRRSWSVDRGGRIVAPSVGRDATDRATVLSSGLCDLKFGFFFRPSAVSGDEGALYHVGATGAPPSVDVDVMQCDKERGFRLAIDGGAGIMKPAENLLNGHNAVMFFYKGFGRVELTDGSPILLRSITALTDGEASGGTMSKYTNFGFSGCRPGDRVYLSGARDDDASQAPGVGSPVATAAIFPPQDFTIDAIAADNDFVGVKFKESINFFNLARRWLGQEYGSSGNFIVDGSNMGTNGGPPRVLRGSFNVEYRVGFLPAAILVRMSIDDPYNRQVHQVERTIRLLQH